MHKYRIVLYAALAITLVVVALGMTVTSAAAGSIIGWKGNLIGCVILDLGTWSGATAIHGNCSGATGAIFVFACPASAVSLDYTAVAGHITSYSCNYPPNYGMRRKGMCKLVSVEDAYLGGYVTVTVKGAPNTLKLKAAGKTYELPLVPDSVGATGEGNYTASFYTLDPVTGQPLVPAGDYTVRCHGIGGSNDGGSQNKITITY